MTPILEAQDTLFREVFGIEGQVAVVTGGASGIGLLAAETLARAGAHVVVASRDAERVRVAVEGLTARGLSAQGITTDVTDGTAVGDLGRTVHAEHGRIDILVNSAGVFTTADATDLELDEWRRVLEINATGTLIPCQVIGRLMIDRGRGKIVNIGSTSSLVGLPGAAAYTASKGAVLQITRTLGAEWAPLGVNVNAIGPCDFRTPMTASFLDTPEYRRWLEHALPIGRPGELTELRGAVLLLCSSAADMIVGHCLMVDGGRTAI